MRRPKKFEISHRRESAAICIYCGEAATDRMVAVDSSDWCHVSCKKSHELAVSVSRDHEQLICYKCGVEKPIAAFPWIREKEKHWCRVCRAEYSAAWVKTHPARAATISELSQRRIAERNRQYREARKVKLHAEIIATYGGEQAYLLHCKKEQLRKHRERWHKWSNENPVVCGEARRRQKQLKRAETRVEHLRRDAEKGILGTIYFIEAGTNGPIKIGYTVHGKLNSRIKSLQCGNHEKLRVLGVMRGKTQADEHDLHDQFGHCHRHLEWFNPSDDLLLFIAENVIDDGNPIAAKEETGASSFASRDEEEEAERWSA